MHISQNNVCQTNWAYKIQITLFQVVAQLSSKWYIDMIINQMKMKMRENTMKSIRDNLNEKAKFDKPKKIYISKI